MSNQVNKEQEIINIVNTLTYFSKNNSQVFYKHGKNESPFALMILDHLNNQESDMLTKYMPNIIEPIVNIDVELLTNWLLDNPEFNDWLLPQDKLILKENADNKKSIIRNIFFQSSEKYEEAKENNGYSILLINAHDTPIFNFIQNLQGKPDLIQESLNNIPSKKRKKSIINLLGHLPSKADTLNSLADITALAIESGVITHEEVSTIITSNIINPNLLIPITKVDQILAFQNKDIKLDYNYINSILGTTNKLNKEILKRDFNKGLQIIINDPFLDFEHFRNSEDLKRNFSHSQKYENLIKTLNKEEERREIISRKNTVETIFNQTPAIKGNFEPPSFKI